MPNVNRILCAVDLSDHSATVAAHTAMLAEKFGAEVIVAYVAPSMSQYVGFHVPPNSVESFVGEIVSGAEKTMETFVEENFPGIKVIPRVVTGYAAEEVLKLAEEMQADMIVMGTHGRTGIDRILFGSVAEKIVKSSPIPVLTVRPASSEGE